MAVAPGPVPVPGRVGAVVVVGDVAVDVVAAAREPLAHGSDAAADVTWSGGGAAANVAAWLVAAGDRAALCARIGDDLPGRVAVEQLAQAGVAVHATRDPALGTGCVVVVVAPDGERTMLPDRGANAALADGDVPDALLTPGGHLHLSGYVLLGPARDVGLRLLERARAARVTTSVDPASAAPLRAAGAATALGWLRGVDLLLPNLSEAAALTGVDDPVEAAGALLAATDAREVVVTCGADGAVWTDGTAVQRASAPSAVVVDTTGAGDAFAAGWLAARRAGATPAEALRMACALGARAVAGAGARPGRST